MYDHKPGNSKKKRHISLKCQNNHVKIWVTASVQHRAGQAPRGARCSSLQAHPATQGSLLGPTRH